MRRQSPGRPQTKTQSRFEAYKERHKAGDVCPFHAALRRFEEIPWIIEDCNDDAVEKVYDAIDKILVDNHPQEPITTVIAALFELLDGLVISMEEAQAQSAPDANEGDANSSEAVN